jgi:hypothetical protein
MYVNNSNCREKLLQLMELYELYVEYSYIN